MHDSQLGGQIVEQLQGAICLTSQIVEGAERRRGRKIKKALPVGSVVACIKRHSGDDDDDDGLLLWDVSQLPSKAGV